MDMQLSEEEKHKICELENFDLSEMQKIFNGKLKKENKITIHKQEKNMSHMQANSRRNRQNHL